ncbi:transposase [Endozoicomonas sp. GU-1]|uniref:transposase n=1 Tax=Endozoicomonas sp. GU-1 TaxID=3009078 RepID=UPI0022B41A98|nr:transposase [Endozoicomonas sp. GU-1]WBA83544.1 transposase [Endozoicomonas sp. GU-1]WBA86477.1 transposase [Endozoicomonas sp. GU-1]
MKLLSDTPVFKAKPGITVPGFQAENTADLEALIKVIDQQADVIEKKSCVIAEQKKHIALLEEYLRLERARLYGRSSEKSSLQGEIFDEAELVDCGEEVQNEASETEKKHKKSQGRRPLSPSLPRFQEKIRPLRGGWGLMSTLRAATDAPLPSKIGRFCNLLN